MVIEWEAAGEGEYLRIDGNLKGYINYAEGRIAYTCPDGVMYEDAPSQLSRDEAKAWALTIYRMAQ